VRGTTLTNGYFNRPDLNNDPNVFTKDGWFRTGDIGQWNEDGTLSIIDRLKNLVKLQSGEYIAIERLEAIYKSCDLAANVCIYATPNMSQPIGIIYPHEANLRNALSHIPSASSLIDEDFDKICSSSDTRSLVLKECNALAKKNGFARMETLSDVILSSEEWTPKNGLVTAAQKLNRAKIAEKFKDKIQESQKRQGQ